MNVIRPQSANPSKAPQQQGYKISPTARQMSVNPLTAPQQGVIRTPKRNQMPVNPLKAPKQDRGLLQGN